MDNTFIVYIRKYTACIEWSAQKIRWKLKHNYYLYFSSIAVVSSLFLPFIWSVAPMPMCSSIRRFTLVVFVLHFHYTCRFFAKSRIMTQMDNESWTNSPWKNNAQTITSHSTTQWGKEEKYYFSQEYLFFNFLFSGRWCPESWMSWIVHYWRPLLDA